MLHKIKLVICLVLASALIACTSPSKFPGGADRIGFSFEIDWDIFESGTYSFIDVKNRRIGGARLGYDYITPLDLKIRLKNGEEFQKSIDVPQLLANLEKQFDLPNIKKSDYGGFASIEIHINTDIELKYRMAMKIDNSGVRYDRNHYSFYKEPLMRKKTSKEEK